MSTVIHIQHDASITTVKAKPTGRHIYSADYRAYSNSNTNFTALYNVNWNSFTSVLLVSSKQPFSPANLSYGPSSAAVRADQGREQGLCVRRNTRHKSAYSLIGWKICHSSYVTWNWTNHRSLMIQDVLVEWNFKIKRPNFCVWIFESLVNFKFRFLGNLNSVWYIQL